MYLRTLRSFNADIKRLERPFALLPSLTPYFFCFGLEDLEGLEGVVSGVLPLLRFCPLLLPAAVGLGLEDERGGV